MNPVIVAPVSMMNKTSLPHGAIWRVADRSWTRRGAVRGARRAET